MKILISSHAFSPSIGGLETVSRLLAKEFSALGHDIVVITQTAASSYEKFPFRVIRRPSVTKLFRLIRWCDVFWQNNLSVRTIWPALILRKPIVITHQGSYAQRPRGLDLLLRLKHSLVNRTTSVAISEAVARCFDTQSVVIPNPYDARVFNVRSTSTPRDDLVFVGRLVSEKGLDTLLESLAQLRKGELRPRLTIVGSGPEEMAMRELSHKLDLESNITFVGAQEPAQVAEILSRQRILVVPSRYDEPFGVVALEGIASGCVVVASRGGGLPEAIGGCGILFPNGNAPALADVLTKLLSEPNESDRLRTNAAVHLTRFHPSVIAKQYVDLFRSKLSS